MTKGFLRCSSLDYSSRCRQCFRAKARNNSSITNVSRCGCDVAERVMAMLQNKLDMVTVDIENAEVRVSGAKGKPKSFSFKVGQVDSFEGQLADGRRNQRPGKARHRCRVERRYVQPLTYNSAFPDAFPREGAIKLLNNKRHGLGLHVDERRTDTHALPCQGRRSSTFEWRSDRARSTEASHQQS